MINSPFDRKIIEMKCPKGHIILKNKIHLIGYLQELSNKNSGWCNKCHRFYWEDDCTNIKHA